MSLNSQPQCTENQDFNLQTMIGTAKLNDVDPQAWLADVFDRISDLPQTRLHELLPWSWMADRQQALAA